MGMAHAGKTTHRPLTVGVRAGSHIVTFTSVDRTKLVPWLNSKPRADKCAALFSWEELGSPMPAGVMTRRGDALNS